MSIGSFFRQLTFAIYYRERNFLLSGAVNDNSKVLYVRDPRDRVEKAAPFLQVDGDPYPAVINGRVTWILDGYTTSDAYPYSRVRCSWATAAQDSLTGTGTTALPDEQFNYIRNSVKATVDAYDGTVTLYAVGQEGPGPEDLHEGLPGRRQAAQRDQPTELVSHVRYPEDLFKLQRDILTRYHVTDPARLLQRRTTAGRSRTTRRRTHQDAQPPYYILAQRPGDDAATFQLTSALNAFNRENLSAFISASSDPETYGQIQVLRLPGNTPFRGPQTGAAVVQHQQPGQTGPDAVQQRQTPRRCSATCSPCRSASSGLLYVEPLYVAGHRRRTPSRCCRRCWSTTATGSATPTPSPEALDQVFGAGAGQSATGRTATPSTATAATSPPADHARGPDHEPAGAAGSAVATRRLDKAVADINAALSRAVDRAEERRLRGIRARRWPTCRRR